MQSIAIVYSTKHGQTAKIASRMENVLKARGWAVELVNLEKKSRPVLADGILLGGPVYKGEFPRQLVSWAKKYGQCLQQKPLAVFTVSLNAADQHPEARTADAQLLGKLAALTGAFPQYGASLAGALNYTRYFWPIRYLMKRISAKAGGSTDTSRDHEYTDWEKVDAFALAFANQSEDPRFFLGRGQKQFSA